MSTLIRLTRDINGYVDFGLPISQDLYSSYLTQNIVDSLTIPNSFFLWRVIFSIDPGTRIWVSYNGSNPVIPTGSMTSTNSELNPVNREIPGGSIIKFITPDANAYLGIALYSFQPYR